MGKIDQNKKLKLEALLHSGFQLFTEKGVQNTTVSDIVNQAKLAKGTFYLYFKDKYDLKDRLVAHQAELLFLSAKEELDGTKYETFEEEVIALTDNIINRLAKNKPLLKFISKNLSWAVFSHIHIPEMNNMDVLNIFEQLITESGRTFRNPKLMIYMIVELVNATCHNLILQKSPVDLDTLKPDLYESIRHIIRQFEIT